MWDVAHGNFNVIVEKPKGNKLNILNQNLVTGGMQGEQDLGHCIFSLM
jgi:hypothetical protein